MNKTKMFIMAFSIVILAGFATATLVDYLSNTVTGDINVESPIRITVDGEESYNLEIFAGQSTSITSLTEILTDEVTGHIAEIKILNFDGEGITVDYEVEAYDGVFKLNDCQDDNGNTYYYIGDPTETLYNGDFTSTTTFNTDQSLDTNRGYEVETQVIMADTAACTPQPAYEFVPTA